jgi:hypothetical protein
MSSPSLRGGCCINRSSNRCVNQSWDNSGPSTRSLPLFGTTSTKSDMKSATSSHQKSATSSHKCACNLSSAICATASAKRRRGASSRRDACTSSSVAGACPVAGGAPAVVEEQQSPPALPWLVPRERLRPDRGGARFHAEAVRRLARARRATGPPPLLRREPALQVHNAPGAEVGPSEVATWATAKEDEVEAFGFKWSWPGRSSKHFPFDWSGADEA